MRWTILYISWLLPLQVFGQVNDYGFGAASVGMARAAMFQQDAFSPFNNIANASQAEFLTVGTGYDNRFQMAAFSTFFLSAVLPAKQGGFGFDVHKFGDALFNEQRVSIGYAHHLEGVSMGIRLGYIQQRAEGVPTRGTPVADVGVTTRISQKLMLGSYLSNVLQARLLDFEDERLPSRLMVGLRYQPLNQLEVVVQGEKEIEGMERIRTGVAYQLAEGVFARTGVSSGPLVNYFGVGFARKAFKVDYALSVHSILPLSHHFSVAFQLTSGKNDPQNKVRLPK